MRAPFVLFVSFVIASGGLLAADNLKSDSSGAWRDSAGNLATIKTSETGNVHTLVVDSGGGGSGGDASAANQSTQITAEQAILAKLPALAQRTPTATVRTADGTIALGCRKLTLVFSSDFAGTVLGAAYPAGLFSLTLDPPNGDTQAAVAYTISAGSITSYETR